MALDERGPEDAKEQSVHVRDLTETDTEPNIQLVEAIAELKGVDEMELETLYPLIDRMVEQMYSKPPSPLAQTELTFVYEGFRITLFQDGTAVFQEHPSEPGMDSRETVRRAPMPCVECGIRPLSSTERVENAVQSRSRRERAVSKQ